MTCLKAILVFAWMGWILLPAGSTLAQGPPSPGDMPEHREERERVRENIETLHMWKLLEALDLTSDQSARFLPALKDFQEAKKTFEDRRRELLRQLEADLESKGNEGDLKEALTNLENNRKEFQLEMDKLFERSRAILTLEQQAKFFLFEDKFERRMKETIEQMRGKHPSEEEFHR
ncbi:MAG: hypothetical protein WCE90_06170 [Candidatus Zixiibacteriota bacterium]